jgi:hypothetical protein
MLPPTRTCGVYMNKSEYQKYLTSREWALLKRRVLDRCGGKCERCHFGKYEESHHLTYERIGHESIDDLRGICGKCHRFLSGESDVDPAVNIEEKPEESAAYNKVLSLQKKLNIKITDADASHDNHSIDRLIRRKRVLNKIQAQYMWFS